MRLLILRAILIVLAIPFCFSWAQTPSQSGTGIEGIIMIGPIRPWPISDEMVSDEIPSSKPLANATFAVENDRGKVASFTTDEQGRFRISLNPGHYTVTRKGTKGGIGRYGPFDVDVVAGQMTEVEWQCDTGIR
jgi:carboxypeptidase family protein